MNIKYKTIKALLRWGNYLICIGLTMWLLQSLYFFYLAGWRNHPHGPLQDLFVDIAHVTMYVGLTMQWAGLLVGMESYIEPHAEYEDDDEIDEYIP